MDQSRFINTYIDVVINSLMDEKKINLQLQTQVKMHEYMLGEKDKVIESLNQQLIENRIADDWKVKYEAAETNYAAIQNKLSHMNTLLSQVNDMKKTITEKDKRIAELEKQLDDGKHSNST
jgi:uncharacterized protein involved in exopolysaccharide biosynthesis